MYASASSASSASTRASASARANSSTPRSISPAFTETMPLASSDRARPRLGARLLAIGMSASIDARAVTCWPPICQYQ